MQELSMHVLDIAENSVRAEAGVIRITLVEDTGSDTLTLEIDDNGSGMDEETLGRTLDPFFTTKTVRKIGLGLPLLAHAAHLAGGDFSIESQRGRGTKVLAHFRLGHIDRQPVGNMAETMITLIAGHPSVDFLYRHEKNGRVFVLDTREIKEELEDIPINHAEVLEFVRRTIIEGLREIESCA